MDSVKANNVSVILDSLVLDVPKLVQEFGFLKPNNVSILVLLDILYNLDLEPVFR